MAHFLKRFAALVLGAGICAGVSAQTKIDVVVFGPPSLGYFVVPIIKSQKLDLAHGLDLNFVKRPPSAYIAQFNSGEFKVGASAALLSVAVASSKGVKVSYLFNAFNYFGAVVTQRPGIRTVKDLEGHQLVAATATTNFAMFKWLAGKNGADVGKIPVQNTAPPGLVGYALADRADAIQLWEPALSVLMSKKPSFRSLELNIDAQWKAAGGVGHIPYLGVAAHQSWLAENPGAAEKLHAVYKDAAAWILGKPAEAAKLISATIKGSDVEVIRKLIEDNARLGLEVRRAADIAKDIETVYAAGLDSGYLKAPVDKSTICQGR
ncbi:MAG: ABC transporter substrate-binding protein [Burkholderiaceae bacterium]